MLDSVYHVKIKEALHIPLKKLSLSKQVVHVNLGLLRNFHNFFSLLFYAQLLYGIFTAIIVYCKVNINHIVLRLYKHSCILFPPVTDDEHEGV